jgi:predicted GIY-YIG superfamily endonuclease
MTPMPASHVYAIASENNAVKIGRARQPVKRMAHFQTGHYQQLTLAYSQPSTDDSQASLIERFVHHLLREKRMAGEWFAVTPDEAQRAIVEAASRVRSGEFPPIRITGKHWQSAVAIERVTNGARQLTVVMMLDRHLYVAVVTCENRAVQIIRLRKATVNEIQLYGEGKR